MRGFEEMMRPPSDVLTAGIARQWLEDELPTSEVISARHGLRGFSMGVFSARSKFIDEIGFAIPCAEAIRAIVAASPLVEIGAGSGFWSALVHKAGGDIIATDAVSGRNYGQSVGHFHQVSDGEGARIVGSYSERNVLMIWPCYRKPWGATVAKAMAEGRLLFLVSEGQGGAVGDDDLFETLDARFDLVDEIEIPQWPGIHDRLTVHRKRYCCPRSSRNRGVPPRP